MKTTTQKAPVSTEHFDWLPRHKVLVGQISDFGDEFNAEWIGRVFHGTNDKIYLRSHLTGRVAEFELTMEERRRTGVRAWRYQGTGPWHNVKVTIYNS